MRRRALVQLRRIEGLLPAEGWAALDRRHWLYWLCGGPPLGASARHVMATAAYGFRRSCCVEVTSRSPLQNACDAPVVVAASARVPVAANDGGSVTLARLAYRLARVYSRESALRTAAGTLCCGLQRPILAVGVFRPVE